MAADDDMAPEDDSAHESDLDVEPASGKRVKKSASASVQLFVAEFRRRAQGLEGAELEAELERLIDRILERHVGAAPQALRAELRGSLTTMLASDPTFRAMTAKLRAAARRDPR